MITEVEGEVDGHNARLLPRSIQEGFFPNRHPFRYSTCPTGLNFSEQMGIKHLLLDKLYMYMYLQRIPYTVANCTIHLNETKYNLGKGKLTKPMHQFCLGIFERRGLQEVCCGIAMCFGSSCFSLACFFLVFGKPASSFALNLIFSKRKVLFCVHLFIVSLCCRNALLAIV